MRPLKIEHTSTLSWSFVPVATSLTLGRATPVTDDAPDLIQLLCVSWGVTSGGGSQ